MKIFGKILLILLALAIVPLLLVGFLATSDAKKIGDLAVKNTQELGTAISQDAEKAMIALGEKQIEIQAELTADRVSTYVLDHPTMTTEDFSKDPVFLAIVNQKVGETGYISLSKWNGKGTGTFLAHPNPQMIGVPSEYLRAKFPDLLAITDKVEETFVGTGGYYKWQETDGSIRDKYLWVTSRQGIKTADGYEMNISATTYIDEFSKPVKEMNDKINTNIRKTQSNISAITNRMTTQNIIILVIVFVVVIIAGFASAKSIAGPIIKLKKVADAITEGNFDVEMPKVSSRDEVGQLTASMEMLKAALKNKK